MLDKSIVFYSDGKQLIKTTDAWEEKTSIFHLGFDGTLIIDIEFLDENIGWIACENGDVYKTIDGGLNWNSYNINNVGFDFKLEKIQIYEFLV